MSLPYENSTTGSKAIIEIQKTLKKFGCSKFAQGEDYESGEVFIQFEHHGRPVQMRVSAKGYAAAWLNEYPYTSRKKGTRAEWESKALGIGSIAVYSILRDWVKAQTTAIECGMLTFDAAFLSHICLPSGQTVIQAIQEKEILPALEMADE